MADTFDIKRCRQLLDEDSIDLNDAFAPWYGVNIESRLEITSDGTMQLALDIINKGSNNHRLAIKEAWKMITESFGVRDTDDPREMVPIDRFVAMNGIPPLVKEFERQVYLGDIHFVLTLTWIATNDRATPHIIAAGAHKIAIAVIEKRICEDKFIPDLCLNLLRNLSACVETRAQLRADGVLEAALPYLEVLERDSEEELDIKRGFRAASIVARLAGNDEQGPVAQLLKGNPALITRMVNVLDKVLDAGPKGNYLGMRINPHFITMDLLVIAVSDANKPMLKNAIPVLLKALKLRGEANQEMACDVIRILLQLTYEKECLKILQDNTIETTTFVHSNVRAPKYDMDMRLTAQNLVNALSSAEKPMPSGIAIRSTAGPNLLQAPPPGASAPSAAAAPPPPAPPARSSSVLGNLMKRGAAKEKEAAKRKSGVGLQQNTQKHVMLSYNWGVKPIVQRVDELLRANGINTWIDDRNMGPNLNDSMADAIENAYVVFVFMTAKYKESANCRKECEYADGHQVPIVYIMAEENYRPNGWLGIQLGKSIWIPCWNLHLTEEKLPLLLKAANADQGANKPVIPTYSSTNASGSTPSSSSDAAAIKALQMELESTRAQFAAQLEALKEDFKLQLSATTAKLDAALASIEELKKAKAGGA